jgi:hypothetical protein
MKRGRPPGSKNKEPIANDSLPILRRVHKELQSLSRGSGITIHQVWLDVLENGLVAVREMYRPLTDGHKTLIEYRKSLREQLEEPNDAIRENTGLSEQESFRGNGHTADGVGGETIDELSGLHTTEERLDLAPVGPGLGAEGDETIASDRGDAE